MMRLRQVQRQVHMPVGSGIICNPRRHRHLPTLGALLLVLLLGSPLAAQEPEEVRARLDELGSRIEAIEERLNRDRGQVSELQSELRVLDQRVSRQGEALRYADQAISTKQAELEALESERGSLGESLGAQREALAALLRAAYASGPGERLRLLLSQDDPDRIMRTLTYYEYIERARRARMGDLMAQLERLREVQQSIESRLAELAVLRERRVTDLAALEDSRLERRGLLGRLRQAVAAGSAEVDELKAQRAQLESVLAAIEEALADIPVDAGGEPFSSQEGRLDWPVSGSVRHRFGQPRAGGQRWQGMLISAEAGAEVRSVAAGRVVYSDWLRGHGLLLIVDHGEGFLSLYAHNQTLFAETGEWVSRGQTVAAVGASGGRSDTGLYFELRKDGKAVNPVRWLAGE